MTRATVRRPTPASPPRPATGGARGLLLLLLAVAGGARGEPAPGMGELVVTGRDARAWRGQPVEVSAASLGLEVPAPGGRGTAVLRWSVADAPALAWTDEAAVARLLAGRPGPARREGIDAAWRARRRILPWTDRWSWPLGIARLRLLVETGEPPSLRVAHAREILPLAPDEASAREVGDAELAALEELGLPEETRLAALRWVDREGLPARSVLGWCVLARLALAAGDRLAAEDAMLPVAALGVFPSPETEPALPLLRELGLQPLPQESLP